MGNGPLRPFAARSAFFTLAFAAAFYPLLQAASAPSVLTFKVPPGIPDAVELASPAAVELDGWLGQRTDANASNRLARVDLEPLLAGFRKKPGVHPWIGEHIGKWMHAATLAWAHTGSPILRQKLDQAAADLAQSQEADGYLGTYAPEKRFGLFQGSDWDVWSHKYNLIGLLTYYQYTGNETALETCRRMADLLVRTFGPSRKSILSAGTHVGMAATSVLEPMVLLYRFTGDTRYLEFARYLVASWEETGGPRILTTLLTTQRVDKTANAKAYEMLSNLVGLCELARVTGNRDYVQAALNAWTDIVQKRLYVTGSASQGEHFRDDHHLPNGESAHVAETCVTTTWIQFNSQLLRLTGEARFADELERTFYNHLAAAQRPDGAEWCYFTPLEGKKPYGPGINCCVSSGPRGMALVPQHVCLMAPSDTHSRLIVNLLETARFTTTVNGHLLTLTQQSEFPHRGSSTITISTTQPAPCGILVRQPPWAGTLRATVNGRKVTLTRTSQGWIALPHRVWQSGDQIHFRFEFTPRFILGQHGNQNRAAAAWGPFILAYDESLNPNLSAANQVGFARKSDLPKLLMTSPNQLTLTTRVLTSGRNTSSQATLIPFADAGARKGSYRVWLRAPGQPVPRDTTATETQESRSRAGNVDGSIIDGDDATFVVTFDGNKAVEDWFAMTWRRPATFDRVHFSHGRNFHDGGWFDASSGKPRVEVQRRTGGTWESVAEFSDYPATTTAHFADLSEGRRFTATLQAPVTAFAVRVIGIPASGDNPNQAFASCAELRVSKSKP